VLAHSDGLPWLHTASSYPLIPLHKPFQYHLNQSRQALGAGGREFKSPHPDH
jgi:hypothetical protein